MVLDAIGIEPSFLTKDKVGGLSNPSRNGALYGSITRN